MATGTGTDTDSSPEKRVEEMTQMVAKYLEDLPPRAVPKLANPSGHVVLLTGTTGSLGAYVLARLVDDPAVIRIYALNRPSANGISLQSRQKSALSERGLDLSVLQKSKVVYMEGDTSVPGLGLPQDVYAEVRKERKQFHQIISFFEDANIGDAHYSQRSAHSFVLWVNSHMPALQPGESTSI